PARTDAGSHPFTAALARRDLDALVATLAPDAVLHSAVTRTPFEGREVLADLYASVLESFEEVLVVDELRNGDTYAFFWEARIDGRFVAGADRFRVGADGLVHEITIVGRPLSGLTTFLSGIGFRFAKRRRGALPAVLWGPIPLINIRYSALADRLYGYRSDTLVYEVYAINRERDFDYVLERLARLPLVGLLVPYGAFLWAGVRYDVFGCFFDGALLARTPWWRAELRLLRLAGKGVVVYPYGGDARLPSETRRLGRWHAYTDVPPGEEDRDEADVRARLAAFGRYADAILGCADLVEHLPRLDGVLRYPFPADEWRPVEPAADGVLTVVHSPNHPHYKGTRYLVEAVEEVRREGVAIELVLVQGMPNDEARAAYERADVIADQFLIGAYALFAIEGMALGKPVLCYLNERFAPYHPEWHECPILNTSPAAIADNLRRLAADPELRRELGRRGPPYVEKYHSLRSVGADLDTIYRSLWGLPAR
ncbi:MAG: nuclear transport factor 2 family protein, partial [Thermoleophilia bacterium]|nr:nuclear transport factor 2 family protein [Thermoleophilia bacterium]